MPLSTTSFFSIASTERMPICTMRSARSIGAKPASPTSSRGPWPAMTLTGMPWRLPDGDELATLKSACASSQNIASGRSSLGAIARDGRDGADRDAVVAAHEQRNLAGREALVHGVVHAAAPRRDLGQMAVVAGSAAAPDCAGPTTLPRSMTPRPSLRSALSSPATRSASGPIEAPRLPAPTSVGAPINATDAEFRSAVVMSRVWHAAWAI